MNNELKESLFEKALKWYEKGDKFREAALELFPEEQLKRELETYHERKKKEELNSRDNVLKKVLERAKETFPIGTVVYNDSGGYYHGPQIIISEPYIGNTIYSEHIPFSAYSSLSPTIDKKTVLAKTLKLYQGKPDYECGTYDVVGLENLLSFIDEPTEYHQPPIVNLDEYCTKELKTREENIKKTQEHIDRYEKTIAQLREELKAYKDYDPTKLTKEQVMKFVEEEKNR